MGGPGTPPVTNSSTRRSIHCKGADTQLRSASSVCVIQPRASPPLALPFPLLRSIFTASEGLIAFTFMHRKHPHAEAFCNTGFLPHVFVEDVASSHQRLEHLGVDGGWIQVFHSLQELHVAYDLLAVRPVAFGLTVGFITIPRCEMQESEMWSILDFLD